MLLAEHEADLPRDLFNQLREDARKLFCNQFYTEINEANFEYYNQFIRFMGQRIILDQPDILDWQVGVLRIRENSKADALIIPKDTILHRQLSKMTRKDQHDSKRQTFYAAGALCNCIGSFDIKPVMGRRIEPSDYIYIEH